MSMKDFYFIAFSVLAFSHGSACFDPLNVHEEFALKGFNVLAISLGSACFNALNVYEIFPPDNHSMSLQSVKVQHPLTL